MTKAADVFLPWSNKAWCVYENGEPEELGKEMYETAKQGQRQAENNNTDAYEEVKDLIKESIEQNVLEHDIAQDSEYQYKISLDGELLFRPIPVDSGWRLFENAVDVNSL